MLDGLLPQRTLTFLWALLGLFILSYSARSIWGTISIIKARRKFRAEKGCYPVTCQLPLRDPIFGIDFILDLIRLFKEKRFLSTFANQYYGKIGNTFSISRGTQQTIFTVEPENIKTVLAVNFKDFGLGFRLPLFSPVTGRGIFAVDGDEWAHSRAMLRPTFAKDQVADLGLIDEHLSRLLSMIPPNKTINLQDLLHTFTLDAGTHFLFGESTNIFSNPSKMSQAFSEAFEFTLKDVAFQIRLGPLRRFQSKSSRKKAAQSYQQVRSYVDHYVEQAIALRNDSSLKKDSKMHRDPDHAHDSLLKQLAMSAESKEKIRDELLSVLIASRDTTSNMLGNLFFVLARRPDVWAKLRREVQLELGPGLPQYEQLRNLKYAKFCINESLRLHPTVPSNGRMAVRDTILPRGGGPTGDGPIHVPKGSMVNYTVYAMHRRKDLWGPDADEFRPERWEDRRPSWEFLPFNGGPRICLGQQYAITEALLTIVRFAQKFEFLESEDLEPWTEEIALGCGSANGVMMRFIPAV